MEKCLILDFDDTLIKTIDVHVEAWQMSLNKVLDINITKDEILNDINYGMDVFLKKLQLTNEEIKQASGLKKIYFNELLHKTKVNDFLLYVIENNIFEHTVIASNSSKENLYKLLNYHNIDSDLFTMILTRDDVKNKKPNPSMGNIILNHFPQYNKKDFLIIGDSNVDELFAKKLNIKCIIVNF